jgi:hypothetical protein
MDIAPVHHLCTDLCPQWVYIATIRVATAGPALGKHCAHSSASFMRPSVHHYHTFIVCTPPATYMRCAVAIISNFVSVYVHLFSMPLSSSRCQKVIVKKGSGDLRRPSNDIGAHKIRIDYKPTGNYI